MNTTNFATKSPVYASSEQQVTKTYSTTTVPTSTYNDGATVYSQYATHAEVPLGSSRRVTGQTMYGQERVQQTRQISSTIIEEQVLGPIPQDYPVREVEVPGPIQEVIKHVPRKEVVETEKRVPRYEYEWVERIVEVPRIEYVDRVVEIPKYQEVIKEVKIPQIVEVPKEVIKEVRVPQVNVIEKIKEVPGEIIEVPKPYTVEQKVELTRYVDRMHPVVVAQTVKPYIVEGQGSYDVDVYEYEPECVPVDVHVIKAVQAQIQAGGVVESSHKVITVPAAQYNTILQQLNTHLSQAELQKLPYKMEASGQASFLGEKVVYSEPQAGVQIVGLDMNNLTREYVDPTTRRVIPIPGVTDAQGNLLPNATTSTTTTTTQQFNYGGTAGYGTTSYGGTAGYGTTSYTAGGAASNYGGTAGYTAGTYGTTTGGAYTGASTLAGYTGGAASYTGGAASYTGGATNYTGGAASYTGGAGGYTGAATTSYTGGAASGYAAYGSTPVGYGASKITTTEQNYSTTSYSTNALAPPRPGL